MAKVNFRERRKVAVDFSKEKSIVKKEFQDQTNINSMLKRFKVTGQIPVNKNMPQYGDVSGVKSFHDAHEVVQQAYDSFDTLPSAIRKRFGNDPLSIIEFLDNPSNLEESYSLGLRDRPIQPAVDPLNPTNNSLPEPTKVDP